MFFSSSNGFLVSFHILSMLLLIFFSVLIFLTVNFNDLYFHLIVSFYHYFAFTISFLFLCFVVKKLNFLYWISYMFHHNIPFNLLYHLLGNFGYLLPIVYFFTIFTTDLVCQFIKFDQLNFFPIAIVTILMIAYRTQLVLKE